MSTCNTRNEDGNGQKFDVIVVGGGIMGSCCAYQTSKRGHSTLLLDQFDLLHNRGSSHGESRTIRVTYTKPHYPPMVLESSKLWEEAQSQVGYKVLYSSNQLNLGHANDPSLEAITRSCQSNSIDIRVLNNVQVAQEFSGGVVVPEDWIGIVSGGAGVIKPTKAVCMFQTLALRNGTVLKDNIKVTDIRRDASDCLRISTASGETFYSRKCIITAGPWMNNLVKAVTGYDVPIEPLEATICYWKVKQEHERDYSIGGGFPTFSALVSPHVFGTPSLEYPGLIKVSVDGGRVCDPDKRTWAPDSELMDHLRKWVKETFGERVEHDQPVSTQSCLYSMTPDKDYVIDFLGGKFGKDVVIAGGFSGHGFKMGPVIGRVVADLVLQGEAKGVDLEHFKLDRFRKNPKGNA